MIIRVFEDEGLPKICLSIGLPRKRPRLGMDPTIEKKSSMMTKLVRATAWSTALSIFFLLALNDCLASQSAPKISWHKSYGGSGEESHPHYVIQTKDTGFLMVGETGFIEDRSARILAVKTDRTGELLWKREFGKRGHNLGNCVSETPDGNYLIAGSLNLDAALIKVDASTGKTLWSKTWNLGTEDAFEGLTVTPNGGILATGYKNGLAEGTFLNWGKEFCSKPIPKERKNGDVICLPLLPRVIASNRLPMVSFWPAIRKTRNRMAATF